MEVNCYFSCEVISAHSLTLFVNLNVFTDNCCYIFNNCLPILVMNLLNGYTIMYILNRQKLRL